MPVLRPATAADEAFLLALTPRLADFPLPPWRTRAEIAAADHPILLAALHRPTPETVILVAEDPASTPAGYVFVATAADYFTRRPHAHVEILAVAPEAVGRGLGRMLLEAAEAWARDRGYGAIGLNVFAANDRARAVYDHLGYRPETIHYWKVIGAAE
jgi:GNAT superfamily N-acetyltransferase